MALELRGECERCVVELAPNGEALICSYECTFCSACSAELRGVCPNCAGELVPRPRRRVEPSAEWLADIRAALDPFDDVTMGRLVPGPVRYELVLTTRESPPDGRLVEALGDSVGELIIRGDSPVIGIERGSTWHFDPPLGRAAEELFASLDWDRALVVRERGV